MSIVSFISIDTFLSKPLFHLVRSWPPNIWWELGCLVFNIRLWRFFRLICSILIQFMVASMATSRRKMENFLLLSKTQAPKTKTSRTQAFNLKFASPMRRILVHSNGEKLKPIISLNRQESSPPKKSMFLLVQIFKMPIAKNRCVYIRAEAHLNAGAKKVIISAPSNAPMYVYGVNHHEYDSSQKIVCAFCFE